MNREEIQMDIYSESVARLEGYQITAQENEIAEQFVYWQ